MSCESVNVMCSETVRYSFVSHLSGSLRRQGVSVSVFADTDDSELETYYLTDDQKNEGARVSVVVFTETYASSVPWFAKHLERLKNNGYLIVPVFYGVDPSVVHRDLDFLGTVKRDGNLTRHPSSDSELLEETVKDVYGKLYPTERIGTYSRLLEIENLICEQPWDVRRLGIWGMPGIGKTTLAKAVFDRMCNDYHASCFIENFDEALEKAGPQRLLEEQIFKIVMEKFGVGTSYLTRLSLQRDKLRDSRILLVLDDVRNPLVAESFLARLDWFGPGSLIIITSRYKQVFALCQVNDIYRVQGLNEQEALQLFSQTVFEKDVPEQNDRELSMKVIDYANGNPLALRVYGRKLKGKKSSTMEAAFLELKRYPPQKVHDMLESVYSTLGDNEKHIFLIIACFFKGENVDYVAELLKGCGYFPRVGIDILVEKCMVTISENTIQMQDLIQDIFSEIITVDRIQMKKCTTMWQPSSIRYLLEDDDLKGDDQLKETPKNTVAEDIKGICLDASNVIIDVKPDAFKTMASLWFVKIYNSQSENFPRGLKFSKGLNSLPSNLRLLHWEEYPLESLPQDFELRELVELSMPYSQLKKLRATTKNLEMLKRIRLCHSQQLLEFSIHEYAQNIEKIDLQGCTRLESFPAMTKLEHLRVLNLSGCSNIKIVPGLPPNIEELYLQGTSIEELPKSIVAGCSQPNGEELMNHMRSFRGFEHIDMESVTNLIKVSSYNQGFRKLVSLNMKDCVHFRRVLDMRVFEALQVLNLSGCTSLEEIKGLPRSIKELYLAGTSIRELPEIPQSLEVLNAHDCYHLKSVRLDFKQLPRHYTFSNCFSLSSETTAEFLEKGVTRVIMSATEENQEHIKKAPAFNMCFPAVKRYSTFFEWREDSCVTVELTPRTQKTLLGFAMSVLVSFPEKSHDLADLGIMCTCTWGTKKGHFGKIERGFKCWTPKEAPRVEKDHMFVFYDREIHPDAGEQTDSDDEIKFEFHTVGGENKRVGATSCMVKGCGVQVITAPTGDKLVSEITGGSEDSIIEEDTKPEEKSTYRIKGAEESTNGTEEDTSLFPRKPEVESISAIEEETLPFPREPEKKNIEKKNTEREGVPPVASPLSSSCSKPPEDQVFINFRGDELGWSFVSHLCDALERNGINVFVDKDQEKGKEIEGLLKEIEGSKIALPIFSPRYSESHWCLKELARMGERNEEGKLVVIPIFYKVDPATIRELRGEFGDNFWKSAMVNFGELDKWIEALKTVACLIGFVLDEKSDEGDLIYRVVKEVKKALNNTSRASPHSLQGTDLLHQKNFESSCGMELRLKQLEEKLSFGSREITRITGVVGPPGIGKSTLVKKFYKKSKNLFLRHVFIPDVHQITQDKDGLCNLRKIILEDLFKVKNLNIETVQAAHEDYQDQLLENRAFVVLDDVSDREQIDAILGKREWIKDGSKIVIATSDKSLIHGLVDDIYEVLPLSYEDSLQHFANYAFGGQSYDSSFLKLSRDFVHYTKGNPLALKILGRELQGKDVSLWYSKLEALSKYPKGRERSSTTMLQSVWKKSYDALNQKQKDTLLDIACFRSLDKDYVASLLDSYGETSTDARIEIAELVDKFLITISGGKIKMHDMLHMFCKELGQEASPDRIGGRRLWDHDKIIDVLDNNKGASRIRSIFLDLADVNTRNLHRQAFVSMNNMRYLQIYNTDRPQECDPDIILTFPDGLKLPLEELRCLHWLKFPLKELPPDFNPQNLVDLKLPYSEIERVWEGNKDALKLKWIDFNHSRKLRTLSGLAEAQNLQELILEGCTALKTLPEDMKSMKHLVFLNLRGCTSLTRLPQINLLSLQILILSNCSEFKVFNVVSENLEAIYLDGTAIEELTSDIGKLQRLALFNMEGCKKLKILPDSLGELKALQELILSGCSDLKSFPQVGANMERLEILLLDGTSIQKLPNIFSLRRLFLSRNGMISRLPENINQFSRLKWLDMKYCNSVTHLPELPPNLQCLDAHGCNSLRTIAQPLAHAMGTDHIHSTFIFTNCNELEQAAKEEIASFAHRKCQLLPSALKLYNKDLVPEILFSTCFPGAEIPSSFSYEAIGSKVQFECPQHWNYNKLSGIALCVVVSFQNCQDQTRTEEEHTNYLSVKCTCQGITGEEPCGQITWKVGSWNEQGNKREAIESEHVFIGYTDCVHLIKHHEAKKSSESAPSAAFLEFSVTDENTSGEARFEVLKSGFSFVFEPDEKKSTFPGANSVATPRTNGGQILPYLSIIVTSFTTLILCLVLIVLLVSSMYTVDMH